MSRKAFVLSRDATVVNRLRAAGAILLGKSNTPELMMAYERSLNGRQELPYRS